MKKIKKLKLTELSKKELETRELKTIKGGDICNSNCGTISSSLADSGGFWHQYFLIVPHATATNADKAISGGCYKL